MRYFPTAAIWCIAVAVNPLMVGIDEAGYGPVLGPLVVSAAAFEVPPGLTEAPLWGCLKDSICATPRAGDRRLIIADSKRVHQRRNGLAELERTVLAAMALPRSGSADADCSLPPPRLQQALQALAPHAMEMLGQYAWYRESDPALPLAADAGMVRLGSARWAREANAAGIRMAGLWCEPLPEGHFNQMVRATRNKAVVLMGLTLRLVQRVADAHPDRQLYIWIDKHGGRDHYHDVLLRAFEGRQLRIVEEGSDLSAYMLHGAPPWKVHFRMEGETHQLPIALASMASKYMREALMWCFNDWWRRHAGAVRSTAGYYEDGMRFVREVEPHLARLGVSREWLVRER